MKPATRIRQFLVAITATSAIVALGAPGASAATITVGGSGLNASQQFVDAVTTANADAAADTIVFTGSAPIVKPTTKITVTHDLTINAAAGPGVTFDGTNVVPQSDTVLAIAAGATVTMFNASVSNTGDSTHPAIDVSGNLSLIGSLLAGNTGPGMTVRSGGLATVTNSTISDGLAQGVVLVGGGTASFLSTTITANTGTGIANAAGSTLNLSSTIVAQNGNASVTSNCSRTAAAADHSLSDIASTATQGCGTTLTVGDPVLGVLIDDGGPTQTHPLLLGSPAIDAGGPTCPLTDQRGQARVLTCDIGADEYNATAPAINVPGPITTPATSASGAPVTFTVTASSTDDAVVDGPTCTPASGSTFPVGATTVACHATDGHENVGNNTFVVTVTPLAGDNTPPVITGSTADVPATATSGSGATVTYTLPTANDAVDGPVPVVCAPVSGSVFAIGTTAVNCTAHDAANNQATLTFHVVVTDTSVPVIAQPGNITTPATQASGATVHYTPPTATDTIDGPFLATCAPASDTLFAPGDTTVTCNATDPHGNHATPVTFTVTVTPLAGDNTPPVITGSTADVPATATSGSGATVTYTLPTANDAVDGPVPVVCAPVSGSVFAIGTTAVNCTAHDAANNQATLTFHVVVTAASPGTITVPGSGLDASQQFVDAVTTANADAAANTIVFTGSAPIVKPTTKITVTHDLTINAIGGPGVTFDGTNVVPQSDTVLTIDASATVTMFNASVSNTGDSTHAAIDVLGNLSLTGSLIAGNTGPGMTVRAGGSATITNSTISDGLAQGVVVNNASTASFFSSTVVANTGTGIANAAGSTLNLTNTIVAQNGNASATSNCSRPAAAASHSLTDTPSTATAGCGTTLTVGDPVVGVLIDDGGPTQTHPLLLGSPAIDTGGPLCPTTDQRGQPRVLTCDIGADEYNATAPVITVPAPITTPATSLAGAVVTFTVTASSSDDAVVDGPTCAPASGSTFPVGPTTVTCDATDGHGNIGTNTFTVTVTSTGGDLTPPVITGSAADVPATATSASGATVTFPTPTATDDVDVGPIPVVCAPASGSVFAIGTTAVDCTAHDAANNQATLTFHVVVTDTSVPVIAQPANITTPAVHLTGATVVYTPPTATDAIDGAFPATCAPASATMFPPGDTTVTCNAVDPHGNHATPVTFTVTVTPLVGRQPPVISGPNGTLTVEAQTAKGAVVTLPVSVSDPDSPTGVVLGCSPASGSTFAIGLKLVSCNAHDPDNHNATPFTFTVNVVDTTGPAIAPVNSFAVPATSTAGALVPFLYPIGVDLVDGNVTSACTKTPGSVFPVGKTTVTCTATDSRGNAGAPVSFTITVNPFTGKKYKPKKATAADKIGNLIDDIRAASGHDGYRSSLLSHLKKALKHPGSSAGCRNIRAVAKSLLGDKKRHRLAPSVRRSWAARTSSIKARAKCG